MNVMLVSSLKATSTMSTLTVLDLPGHISSDDGGEIMPH